MHFFTRALHGPHTRYVKLWVAHAPGILGTLSPTSQISNPDMHHGTYVTHVPWCMSGSLTSGFLWSRWRGKCSRHFRCMCNPQFYVFVKRPMGRRYVLKCASQRCIYFMKMCEFWKTKCTEFFLRGLFGDKNTAKLSISNTWLRGIGDRKSFGRIMACDLFEPSQYPNKCQQTSWRNLPYWVKRTYMPCVLHTDGIVQDCGRCIALAIGLPQFCTKPSM